MNDELSPKANEILACARTLLAAGGYNGFSYADISDRVRISKASIHHHFPSKAELVRTVVRLYRAEARAGMAGLEKQIASPLAQLRAYTAYWANCIQDNTAPLCICAMLAAEMPAIPREVAAEVRRHFTDLEEWLTSVLAKGVKGGVIQTKTTPKSEAMGFLATIHGAMLSARAYGDPEIFGAIVQPVLRRLADRG
jgi:TetR/AcrR family transcriptional repressor of nem operon